MKKQQRNELLRKQGYDYSVLLKLWGLKKVDYSSPESDDLELKILKDYMRDVLILEFDGNSNVIDNEVKHTMGELAEDIRAFLTELSKYHNSYYDVLWEGMAKIKDDFSLIVMTIAIIGFMWD